MQTASKRSAWEFGAAKLQQRSAACVNAFMIVPDFHVLKWLLGSQSFLSNMSHRFFKALPAWSNFEYPKCSLLLRNHHHQQHLLHLHLHHHQAAAILQPLCLEEGFWWEIRFSWRPFCFPTSSLQVRHLPASTSEVYSGDITKADAVGEYCRFSSWCILPTYFTFNKIWLSKNSLKPDHYWWYYWFSMVGWGWILLLMFGFRWVFLKFSEILQIRS